MYVFNTCNVSDVTVIDYRTLCILDLASQCSELTIYYLRVRILCLIGYVGEWLTN
jgi:hypothetical protein